MKKVLNKKQGQWYTVPVVIKSSGGIAQPGERPLHTREVTGSSPVAPILIKTLIFREALKSLEK